MSTYIVLLWDFNIHIDNTSNSTTSQFLDIIQTAGLFVNLPTHKAGHILDLVTSRPSFVKDVRLDVLYISDHSPVYCYLDLLKPRSIRKEVSSRNYRRVNLCTVQELIEKSESLLADVTSAVYLYNQNISSVLDKVAPLRTCR